MCRMPHTGRDAVTRIRWLLSVGLASAVAALLVACSGTHRSHSTSDVSQPVLGSTSTSPSIEGFGTMRPSVISFGGDPTSVVSGIAWASWGGSQAIGNGESDWVWPGTCTGCNKPSRARVVAFAPRRCRGHIAYSLLEWYFPEYGEKFESSRAISICGERGASAPSPQVSAPTSTRCPPALLEHNGVATEVMAEGLSCLRARQLIHGIPGGSFKHERRFVVGAFRCGTEGAASGNAIVSCGLEHMYVTFSTPAG